MSTEKSVREIVEEWNTKAKAEGRYLDQDPWSIQPAASLLLDIPETPESRERIEWLKQQIAELQRQRQAQEEAALKEDVPPIVCREPAFEEQPPVANRPS